MAQTTTGASAPAAPAKASLLPYLYNDKKFETNVSTAEKDAMKGTVELSVVTEPMDHFTTFDDNYLQKLINEQKKGAGYEAVLLKDGMRQVATEVMGHWYNVKGGDLADYMSRFFDSKWAVLDNRNKG